MSGDIAARRYAGALFAVGGKTGLPELERFSEELALLSRALLDSPALVKLCRSPVFSPADKSGVISTIASRLGIGEKVRNFCRLLSEKGRLAVLPAIAAHFDRLLDEKKGILRGELISAVELDENKRRRVLEKLIQQTGRQLVLGYAVDSSILGGVVLKVEDRVLDASLRAQLSILKEQIKRGV
ncbi:MAG: ATP synthase F1 subunit delta [Desulfovibrionaceae bacterium]|nr:ATP synthase F1 subunit delta [Desulfovibrionaceae bacterium]